MYTNDVTRLISTTHNVTDTDNTNGRNTADCAYTTGTGVPRMRTVYYNGFPSRVFQANAIASQAEKRQRTFDKTIDEWKRKVADLQAELDNAHAESRGSAAEVYRLKSQLEEYSDNIEALRRENKNLSGSHVFLLRGTIGRIVSDL